MKRFAGVLLVVLALLVLVGGAAFLLIESGEVVVLRTGPDDGGEFLARLWVVDHDGTPWIGKLDPSRARWVARLRESPRVQLVRGGVAECRDAVFTVDPDTRAELYALFEEKYRVELHGARTLGLLLAGNPDLEEASRSAALLRLDPCEPAEAADTQRPR